MNGWPVVALVGIAVVVVLVWLARRRGQRDASGGQAGEIQVQRRETDAALHADGELEIMEVWHLRLPGRAVHSLVRWMPDLPHAVAGRWHVAEGRTEFVQEGSGLPGTFEVLHDEEGGQVRWHIPAMGPRRRTYILRYTLRGVVTPGPDRDELLWTPVEAAGRPYAIEIARVWLALPRAFKEEEVSAELIPVVTGSQVRGRVAVDGGWSVKLEGVAFVPGIGCRLRVSFPHGTG